MTLRRSSANLSRIAVISVAMTARSRAGSARIASSSAIVWRSWVISSSSSLRPRRVRRPRVMSKMWLACSSENENGSAIRAPRAAGRSSEPRMAAMTASSMSMARSRPSTMWARARALRSRNSLRRVSTSTWWAT